MHLLVILNIKINLCLKIQQVLMTDGENKNQFDKWPTYSLLHLERFIISFYL